MKNHLVILCFFFLQTCLVGQITNYDMNTGKKQVSSERITLEITKVPKKNMMFSNKNSGLVAVATILPTLLEEGINIIQNILKDREARFTGEYKASASESGFWLNKEDMNLPKLTLTRQLISTSPVRIASKIVLTPEQSTDGTAFRYKLESLDMNYSKARLTSKYKEINLKIDIKFTILERKDGKFIKSVKETNSIELSGVQAGSLSQSLPNYTGWFAVIPNSGDQAPNGNYEMEVTVKEVNPAKLKIQRIREFLESNSESLTSVSKIIIEKTIGKEEE